MVFITGAYSSSARSSQLQRQYEAAQNVQLVKQYNELIQHLTSIHTISIDPIDWNKLNSAAPPVNPSGYGFRQAEAIDNLESYKPGFLASVIKPLSERKKKKLHQKIEQATIEDKTDFDEWYRLKILSEKILNGDTTAYKDILNERNPFSELSEFGYGYEFRILGSIAIDVEFRIRTDIIPDYSFSLTQTGKLSKKTLTKTVYYELVQDYVCSVSHKIARDLFALLPVKQVIVNALESGTSGVTGYHEELTVLSVLYDRDTLERINIQRIDPSDALKNFTHNIKFQKTSGLSAVDRII